MAGAIADAMAAPVETGDGDEQEVWVDFAADSSGSRIFIWPGSLAWTPAPEGQPRGARDG